MAKSKKQPSKTHTATGVKYPKSLQPSKSDYERIPGSSRSYRDKATGKIISRRQYDKLIRTGGKSYERIAKERAQAGLTSGKVKLYNKLKADLKAQVAKESGKSFDKIKVKDKDFAKRLHDINQRLKYHGKDKKKLKDKFDALVELGRVTAERKQEYISRWHHG